MEMQQRTLTLGDSAAPFGCCNYFDSCADEILSLTYRGRLGLLDWLGWKVTQECLRSVEFITYRRPEQSQMVDTPGYQADPCADPYSWEIGTRKLTVEDFGRITRAGPTREILKPQVYCKTRPRYRLDGSPVTTEQEWDMLFTADAILDDMRKLVITGNAATPGQFDGLQQWVSTAHGGALNSYVVDWNGNDMAGGAGITVNGKPVGATYDLIDVLLSIFRQIMQRKSWSPELSGPPVALGDMILVLPTSASNCLLDMYTCWSVCGGNYSTEMLQSYEARTFRDRLISAQNPANMFGHGYITLDGVTIPLLTHDWELLGGPTRFDMYFLTGQIGGRRVWEGEFLSADEALGAFRQSLPAGVAPGNYFSLDGGRMLGTYTVDNECYKLKLWHHPRLFCLAPWMQVRFQDVVCHSAVDPLSADPADTSFYPETSFDPATC